MKKIINIQVFVALLFLLSSCDSWLDLAPTAQLSDKAVWEDEASADKYVNGFQNLPEEWPGSEDKGRLTKYAALAFQSRAMLYAKRWQVAYDAADEVVKSEKFDFFWVTRGFYTEMLRKKSGGPI